LRIQEGKMGHDVDEDENERGDGVAGPAEKHTFAPRDMRLLVFDPKENREGLGYEKGRGKGKLPARRPGESR
jgi:G patch domain-containing protein 1